MLFRSISQAGFQLGVVASFGRLLPAALIDSFPLGVINVHGSLLPRWRGAAPVIHALAAGDTETGVSVMRVRPRRFDIGEVLAHRRVAIGQTVARKELTAQLAAVRFGRSKRNGIDAVSERWSSKAMKTHLLSSML